MAKVKKVTKKWLRKMEKRQLRQDDMIWSSAVRKRDNFTCQLCGKVKTGIACQSHHIISRRIAALRHLPDNGICLCWYCHRNSPYGPHMGSFIFVRWLKEHKKSQYNYLCEKVKEYNLVAPLFTKEEEK